MSSPRQMICSSPGQAMWPGDLTVPGDTRTTPAGDDGERPDL
jgi:hypothetical protein